MSQINRCGCNSLHKSDRVRLKGKPFSRHGDASADIHIILSASTSLDQATEYSGRCLLVGFPGVRSNIAERKEISPRFLQTTANRSDHHPLPSRATHPSLMYIPSCVNIHLINESPCCVTTTLIWFRAGVGKHSQTSMALAYAIFGMSGYVNRHTFRDHPPLGIEIGKFKTTPW